MKQCTTCKTTKPLGKFSPYRHMCKDCVKEENSLRSNAHYLANKEMIATHHANWRAKNAEKKIKQDAIWRKDNPHLIAAKTIRRKRSVKQATPAWANQSVLAGVYRDAREFRDNKTPATVDHIIPLNAKLACGLHNEFNVTLKLGGHNFSKCNKFDPMAFDPLDHPTPRHFTEAMQ